MMDRNAPGHQYPSSQQQYGNRQQSNQRNSDASIQWSNGMMYGGNLPNTNTPGPVPPSSYYTPSASQPGGNAYYMQAQNDQKHNLQPKYSGAPVPPYANQQTYPQSGGSSAVHQYGHNISPWQSQQQYGQPPPPYGAASGNQPPGYSQFQMYAPPPSAAPPQLPATSYPNQNQGQGQNMPYASQMNSYYAMHSAQQQQQQANPYYYQATPPQPPLPPPKTEPSSSTSTTNNNTSTTSNKCERSKTSESAVSSSSKRERKPSSPPPPVEEKEDKETKKAVPIMVGKRRGGRVLPTGVVKKQKVEDDNAKGKSDAWSQYMAEVRRYKDQSCTEERQNRPLVK